MFSSLIVITILSSVTSQQSENPTFFDFLNFDISQTKLDEGVTLEEKWVNEAVLNVAYYLRSHKFNEYDRRYPVEPYTYRYLYGKFPEPPLRTLHWEVSNKCEEGIISCLQYLQSIIDEAKLSRAVDTVTLMRKHGWSMERDKITIERAEEECRNLYDMDWGNPEPFQGPLQRFQFRVTASYYLCKFTLERKSELSAFGEPCDNFGNCLFNGTSLGHNDPRADDKYPFACAYYSFCPDPCCPVKQLKSDAQKSSCGNHFGNPCIDKQQKVGRDCKLEPDLNTDFISLTLNRWNTTCECPKSGYRWDSRFGSCVDVDECQNEIDNCNRDTEICYNLEGTFGCGCNHRFWYDSATGKCVPISFLKSFTPELNFTCPQNQKPD